MKVTFIQPGSVYLLDDRAFPPLGILYLASWLRKHGHEVTFIDLAGVPDWKKTLYDEAHKMSGAAWVGITCTTPQYYDAMKIRDRIRALELDVPVVVGGIHITSLVYANEMDFLKTDGFDAYCTGEGYNAVLQMCDDVKNGVKLSRLYSAPILKNIDELPFAARDLIDLKSYNYKLGGVLATSLYTQYGCHYQCSYCESRMAGSNVVRMMNPQRIQDEVRHIRDTYGVHGMMFYDDELNLDKGRFLGICDKLRELGDITWRGFVVASKWDALMAVAAKKSGCYEIASGIESGSPKILKNIMKPATREINKRFVITAKRAGLRVKAFMIVGLPGETWDTIRESDTFLEELKSEGCAPDDIDFSITQVYKGSNIYRDRAKLDIQFKDDYEKSYYKSIPTVYNDLIQVRTSGMTEYDLLAARNYLELRWKKIRWMEDATGRKDIDKIYHTEDFQKSVRYAEEMMRKRVL